jgi:CRP-like cAMP-binding protein
MPALVRLLDVEPDFGAGIDAGTVETARRATLVPAMTLRPGPCHADALHVATTAAGPFAALMLEGILTRDCQLADRVTTQLFGPGDVVPLRADASTTPVLLPRWFVAADTRVAVFDQRFLAATQRWPWLAARVVERSAAWADRALALQAISHIARVDRRIIALLWHLADRWGRFSRDGPIVPLTLTHAAIGTLIGAQRPTVSLAITALRASGALQPHEEGWLLSRSSLALLESTASAPAMTTIEAPIAYHARMRSTVDAVCLRAAQAREEAQRQRERALALRAAVR